MFSMRLRLLPSATKLRTLCFYRRMSVHGWGGCAWSRGRGVSAPGGWPGPRGSLLGGVCLGGFGGVCSGGGGVGVLACTETDPRPRERRPLLRTVRIILECILVNNDLFPNE